MKRDYETVILHYINEKEVNRAINKLYEFSMTSDKINELYTIFTKYSHIFMKYEPELTIDLLLKNFKNSIDPNKIISAIMNTELEKREKDVKEKKGGKEERRERRERGSSREGKGNKGIRE